MRLDKFLQLTRLVKKRQDTRELSEAGRLDVSGRPAKPARLVGQGDIISLRFWKRTLTVKVSQLPRGSPGSIPGGKRIYIMK